MSFQQNVWEQLKEKVRSGELTVAQANVEKVRLERVLVVEGGLTSDLRKALNAAVKTKELCRMKKDGSKPEVYYHPNFAHLANHERNKRLQHIVSSLLAVCG